MRGRIFAAALTAALTSASVVVGAHITPVVTMRKQADVIRETLPDAVSYEATTVDLGKSELQKIVQQAHYTPDVEHVKFYSGRDQNGRAVGTVVFPQVDTQHGPLEVGVTINPAGAITSALVTRATAEMKPWVLDVERSGVLSQLKGETAGDPLRRITDGKLGGMPGYMADVIATATYRALVLRSVLLTGRARAGGRGARDDSRVGAGRNG